jgi:tetratricopeptide (TPR) repeat protein
MVYESNGDREAVVEAVRAADLLPNDFAAQLRAGRLLLLAHALTDAKTRAEKALALNPQAPEGLILVGNIMAGMKDFDGAITEYQSAIALNGSDEVAYANIATLQSARGANADAEANFRKAVEVAPKSLTAREALASFLWMTGRTADAETTLKEALALAPDDFGVNRALGLLYIGSNRAPEAEPFFKSIARKTDTPTGALTLADYYRLTRRVDEARHVLQDLARKDQNYAMAMTRLAAIDASEGQLAQGLAKTGQVLEKFPKDMPARLMKAQILAADSKRDDALAVARSIPTDDPTSSSGAAAFMLIGALEADRGESVEAIKAYEEVLRREPRPLGAWIALAKLNLAVGSVDKAATYVQQALEVQPKSPVARSLLVRIWLAQHKLDQANTEIAALIKEFPNAPIVLDLVAAQQLANNKPDGARQFYLHAISLSPHDLEAATGLVRLDLAAGKIADAVARVEEGLKQPAPSGGWFLLAAQTFMVAKDYAKAEKTLTRAIEVEPSRLSTYALLGQLLASQGRLEEARKEFELIVQRAPRSISANTMLAILQQMQGKMEPAERQYRAVLALDDQAVVAANNLAWIYAAGHRQLDEALQLAQTAVRQQPAEPHINDTLGWIYYQRKAYHDAIPFLETSAHADPAAPETQYHLGMAYYQDGLWDKARPALQAAVASKAPFDGIEEAKKTLAVLGER